MKEITAEELSQILKSKKQFVLLDCRSEEKYKREHIPQALSLSPQALEEGSYEKIIPNKKTLIITSCSSFLCDASLTCHMKLKQQGYQNLVEYPGGLADWKAHNFKTIKSK